MWVEPVKKILLTSFLVTAVISCAYTWQGQPRNIEARKMCDPMGPFPQMIQIPMYKKAWQVVHSCNHPAEPTSIAMSIFYMEWRFAFGDSDGRVWDALNEVMIEWSIEKKRGVAYDISGKYIQEASYGGLALTPSYIWVKPHIGEIICESALIHELVHISIWALKGTDGDPDHMGPKYSGWSVDHSALIQRTNNALCSLGI